MAATRGWDFKCVYRTLLDYGWIERPCPTHVHSICAHLKYSNRKSEKTWLYLLLERSSLPQVPERSEKLVANEKIFITWKWKFLLGTSWLPLQSVGFHKLTTARESPKARIRGANWFRNERFYSFNNWFRSSFERNPLKSAGDLNGKIKPHPGTPNRRDGQFLQLRFEGMGEEDGLQQSPV